MNIVMLGAGYVGLTTGACLAELGHHVTCCDIDADRIRALERGEVPFFEPGLAELVSAQAAAGRLVFAVDAGEATREADAVFVAVGTPSTADGDIDLTLVDAAALGIAPQMRQGAVLVLKSTVVAGTARRIGAMVAARRGAADVAVAANPEFLRQGSAIGDFLHADRIVIGADDPVTEAALRDLYRPLTDGGVPLMVTETVNAELIKYAANAFLALRIGFINDVADLCEAMGGDVLAVAQGMGQDRRIGPGFLAAGPGIGGSCFPKDARAFAATGRHVGAPQPLVDTLIERNEKRKQALAERIIALAPRGGRVAVLGTSFKANTDDIREAAALTIVPMLVAAGLDVHAHDPQPALARRALAGVQWHDGPIQAAQGADLVVVLTEWADYRELDLEHLAQAMRGRQLLDFRNVIDRERARVAGLAYSGIGRAAGGQGGG